MTLEKPNSLVFLACHWIGDTFWASQAAAAAIARFPGVAAIVYTKPGCLALWHGLLPPECVRPAPFITSDRHREHVNLPALVRAGLAARRERFDLMIDLTGNRYSALFTGLAKPRRAVGFNGGWLGRWAYDECVPIPQEHLACRPWRVCAPLLGEIIPANPQPLAALPESYGEAVTACGLDPLRPVVIIAPGSGWNAKEWHPAYFQTLAELVTRQEIQVVVCGGSGQQELCKTVAARGAAVVTRTVVGWPLGRIMALLSGCAAFIGNDSGLGHLAAAYTRPVLTLFTGATNPAVCRPLGRRVTILDTRDAATTPDCVAAWVMNTAAHP